MDYSSIIAGRDASSFSKFIDKTPSTTTASTFRSTWTSAGSPQAGTTPTTAAICTSATTGAIPLAGLAVNEFYYVDKTSLTVVSTIPFLIFISDRLAHMGGLSGTSVSAQTVGVDISSLSAERLGGSDYASVSWFLEWYGSTGSTARTATISYTNAAGTSGQSTTVSIPASTSTDTMILITGSSGEAIKSIQSLTLNASTGTAGNFGVTALRQHITTASFGSNYANLKNWKALSLPKLQDDVCLFMHVFSTTTGVRVYGRIHLFTSSD